MFQGDSNSTLLPVLCGVGSVVILGLVWVMTRRSAPKPGLLHLFTGKYLHPQRCSTTFQWEDPAPVGTTVSFTVQVRGALSFSSLIFILLLCNCLLLTAVIVYLTIPPSLPLSTSPSLSRSVMLPSPCSVVIFYSCFYCFSSWSSSFFASSLLLPVLSLILHSLFCNIIFLILMILILLALHLHLLQWM